MSVNRQDSTSEAPIEEGVEDRERSEVFDNHQESQPRHHSKRCSSVSQLAEEDDVSADEHNCSQQQHPGATREIVFFHNFDRGLSWRRSGAGGSRRKNELQVADSHGPAVKNA